MIFNHFSPSLSPHQPQPQTHKCLSSSQARHRASAVNLLFLACGVACLGQAHAAEAADTTASGLSLQQTSDQHIPEPQNQYQQTAEQQNSAQQAPEATQQVTLVPVGGADRAAGHSEQAVETQAAFDRLQLSDAELVQTHITDNPNIAQATRLFLECTKVQTDAARLACYDQVAQSGSTPSFTEPKQPLNIARALQSTMIGRPLVAWADGLLGTEHDDSEDLAMSVSPVAQTHRSGSQAEADILSRLGVTEEEVGRYSPLSLAFDLDRNSERGLWSMRPHYPIYLLPVHMNLKPNRHPSTPTQEMADYTSDEMRVAELKFQVSMKNKVAEDLFGSHADLWFGYTQQSHWQVYNESNSRPFRTTDYMPELFLTQPVEASLPVGGRLRMLGAGVIHHSNGESDPLSRSWNRGYVMAGAEWGNLTVIPRLWTRIQASDSNRPDDNPDILDFFGYGDLRVLYDLGQDKNVVTTLRYNPATQKGAVQVDYSFPFRPNLSGYLQLFHGYGEALIDYNHKSTTVGIGVVLNDWKGL